MRVPHHDHDHEIAVQQGGNSVFVRVTTQTPEMSTGAGSGLPLGKSGDLPPQALDAATSRTRFLAVQADRIRHQLQAFQSQEKISIPTKASWCCGKSIIPAEIRGKKTGAPGYAGIYYYEESAEGPAFHAIAGTQKCSSPYVCPVCGRAINAKRRDDLSFTTKKMVGLGYSYAFLTFTAGHKYGDSLKEFVESFQEAQRSMRKPKAYKLFKERWNIAHQIRTNEITLDHPDAAKKSGWHWHSHIIVYLDRPLLSQAEAEQMQAELAAMWTKHCAKHGLKADAAHGVSVERPHCTLKGKRVLADEKNVKKLCDYMAKAISFEASPAPSAKVGRSTERITHWQMLALATLHGRTDLLSKVDEFVQAMKGRRSIYMSRGLADLVGLNVETDEEVTQGELGDQLVYPFEDHEWIAFAARGVQRAACFRIDDGADAAMVVEQVISGIVSAQSLDRSGSDHRLAALPVFDAETGEVLRSERDVADYLAGDNPPVLALVGASPEPARAPMRGRLPISPRRAA